MPDFDVIDVIEALIQMAVDKFWALLAVVFDATRHLGLLGSAAIIVGLAGLMAAAAFRMQKRHNTELKENPEESVSIWFQEVRYTLPYLIFFIITLPIRIAKAIGSAIGEAFSSLFGGGEDGSDKSKEDEEKEMSVVSATFGPSYFLASLVTAVLYALARLLEPLLRFQLDLSSGLPAWQYVILGGRPEMEWYIPLSRDRKSVV